jgi:DNA modification methylase
VVTINGNALHLPLADNSVQCVVTSPPYFGLRDYGVDAQIGLEPTPEEYVANLVAVFREVRRVLRDDGTLWLNLGDSYAGSGKGQTPSGAADHKVRKTQGMKLDAGDVPEGLKPKDLIGIPWRVAFALQTDGWWLRSDIVWAKPNVMPSSVKDRCTSSHEYLFLLTKRGHYYYDARAIAEPAQPARACGPNSRANVDRTTARGMRKQDAIANGTYVGFNERYRERPVATRNKRDVWTIATRPYSGAHFATMPPDLVEPCIKAGTSERGCCPKCGAPWERVTERTGHVNKREPAHVPNNTPSKTDSTGWAPVLRATDLWRPTCACDAGDPVPCVVLDPFAGAGTVAMVAARLGRQSVGVELSPEYCRMAEERIYQDAPLWNGGGQ